MIIILLAILLTALCIPLLHRILGDKTAYLLALLPLSAFAWFMSQYFGGVLETPLRSSLEWNSYFNLRLDFYLDGLSLLFSLMITGIGTLIYFYAAYYMKVTEQYSRFFIFLTVFMASMLGLVLADNLLSIIVFWEMTSITSFMLIGYNHEKESARYAALQGLLVTATGGLALLAGLVLLGVATGEYNISELAQYQDSIVKHKLYLPILLCVLTGAFTKSAQVPFHFWLPNAMAAPTPVSAYLHSATMVKAGVYFVARFFPVLGDTFEWSLILTTFGTLTMLTGAIMAFRSDDLKKILAYSTISALGIMVLAFGIGTKAAIYAGMAYILAHAMYKSALFMLAGIVDKHSGTRVIGELPVDLYKKLPIVFALVLLAALSLGGILPFFGFIAKEMLLEMTLSAPAQSLLISIALLITGALFVALLLMLTHKTFFKKQGTSNENISKASFLLYAAPMLVAALGFFFGLFPNLLSHLISGAAQSLDGNLPEKHLALWHGVNTAFLLSLLSILLGAGLYFLQLKFNTNTKFTFLNAIAPSRIYDHTVSGMLALAKMQTKIIQNGRLRYYVVFTLLSVLLLTGFTFFYKAGIMVNYAEIDIYAFEVILGVIILLALFLTVKVKSKIGSLLSLATVGIVISIVFLEAGAPDLAITFFLIDALTITLFVLILHTLPKKAIQKSSWIKIRDMIISLGLGALVTFILLAITYNPLDSKLKDFYSENSYALAKGKNIVNVILVDFRSIDTFGEITVLAIAALGVFAIVNYSKKPKKQSA